MSERGVFAVDRAIWEHDYLVDSAPFSRREAWLWLVSEAAWKPHRRRIVGKSFDLTRGQLAASTRFIAGKWRWSEARVRRFLKGLKNEGMIDAKTDAGLTVLTIRNYNAYQRVSLPSDAKTDESPDAGATQERRKVEDKEDKELYILTKGDFPSKAFERFYERYPHKVGKAAAKRAFDSVQKQRRATFDALMAGLEKYIEGKPPDRSWCNPATWLNQDRWDDKPDLTPVLSFGGRNGAGNYSTNGSRVDPTTAAVGRVAGRFFERHHQQADNPTSPDGFGEGTDFTLDLPSRSVPAGNAVTEHGRGQGDVRVNQEADRPLSLAASDRGHARG